MTAKDLLLKMLEYNYNWADTQSIDSKPATGRLTQIEYLIEVFGLSKKYANASSKRQYYDGNGNTLNRSEYLSRISDLEYVLEGEFLRDRAYGENKDLADKIISVMNNLYPNLPESMSKKPIGIDWLFNDLLNFRQVIYQITYPWGGMLEGFSPGLHYSKYLQYNLKEIIKANLDDIDDTLWEILDPQKRNFTNEEISYEEVDFDKMDLEWRMENY